ncbi:MAG: phosphoadenylyl-sulfate reductase [Flavobacteriia bacterium]|nr:MAG: phosphoadenylyl-sulfate reductase [Flavobacteriia bacterium]
MTNNNISEAIKNLNHIDRLKYIAREFPGKVIFTTSFGIEDQVITDMIFKHDIPVKVVTLDTGRLFEETYKVYYNTLNAYRKPIQVFYPNTAVVEQMVSEKGPYSFYESIENRKQCCNIRKVEPLQRALNGMDCWVTGIRAEQSSGRTDMSMIEDDEGYGLLKFNPLLDWTLDDVMNYLKQHHVPYNSLHDKGFVSIGCAPCTRAIKPGDDFRAGRWWWENNSGKECGLHTHGT